jgi:RHS repeat-associated protein
MGCAKFVNGSTATKALALRSVLCVLSLLSCAAATAQNATVFTEQGQLVRASQNITALGADLMGDKVNLYTGAVEFSQTDVSLPGNSALPVSVGRRYVTGMLRQTYYEGLFVDWDLEIPHLHGIYAGGLAKPKGWVIFGSLNRCSSFAPPPDASTVSHAILEPNQFWAGHLLYVPGAGDEKMLKRDPANTTQPSDGNVYPIVTKSNWQFRCNTPLTNPVTPDTADRAGEGFTALSPDGTQYRFDWMVGRGYQGASNSTGGIERQEVWIMPTLVIDRFGNTVTYTYDTTDPWKLKTIAASDGRSLTLTYGSGHRVVSVTDGTRTWSYGYNTSTAGAQGSQLTSVTLPDSSAWGFNLGEQNSTPTFNPKQGCSAPNNTAWTDGTLVPKPTTSTVTHPSGATASFTMAWVPHGRSMSGSGNPCPIIGGADDLVTPIYAVRSLVTKSIGGPGLPAALSWSYDWSTPNATWNCAGTCPGIQTLTVTDARGFRTRYTHGNQSLVNEGQLQKVEEGWNGANALRTTTSTYRAAGAGPYPTTPGNSGVDSGDDLMETRNLPLAQKATTQQGVTFTWQATAFDALVRVTGATRSSTLGYSKTEATAYADNTKKWVMGQVASRTVSGIPASSTTFDPATALPTASYEFGKLKGSYAFYADGTLKTVKDALLHTTSYSNYKHGLAENILYADNTNESAVVNDLGLITSLTNAAGTTTGYGYDSMGRLARITPPTEPALAYNPTTIAYQQVPSDELGLGANHWRQTITTGNAVTTNYFDGLLRKRVSNTYDTANPGGTSRMQLLHYDADNRPAFASYPARSIASITTSVPGTTTLFETLGRPYKVTADSELGVLTTNIDYLTGFQKQVTNPRGYVTTTNYQVFDEPSESAITVINAAVGQPEAAKVTISRDVFGKPLVITRSGGTLSATRSYVYDSNQLLCKTIEPEIGATIQSLDAANNVSWRAIGLALPSTTSCDTSSVPAAKKIAYAYDLRNRLTGTGFGDGSPSIGRGYTPDGLPATVISNGSTWTYTYNNRRLLTRESLVYGSTYNIDWGYDANAHTSQLKYPDNAVVSYVPNALGEATQVSGYASGVSYWPNGAVAGYTLANGTVHSTTQNTRGLPRLNIDAGVMQDQYDYDANANITAIADKQESITTRGMGYDGLDRLIAANAPAVWGSASYGYDALDNLRTSIVGSRSSTRNYDTNNRLSTITTNGVATGYAYDTQGNITGRGTKGFYFDQGNRMTLANGVASYTYDGLGRRTSVSANDGSYRVQVYDQGGQLLYGTLQSGALSQATRYVYLGGKAIAETNSATGTSYIHTDALGSRVASVGTLAAAVVYSCPSGWTLSGSTCNQGTTTTIAATLAGYTCPSGYTPSGSSCSLTTVTTSAATVTYSCPAGGTLSGSTCTTSSSSPATPAYACPAGYTLSGASCSGTASAPASVSLSCKGHGTLAPYASSSSGYSCMIVSFATNASSDPDVQCASQASSYGLVVVDSFPGASPKTWTCVIGPASTYACPAGSTLSGTNCLTPSTVAASVSSYSCASGTLSGSSCVTTSISPGTASFSCPAGQTLSGSSCSATTTITTAGTPKYSCPSGYTLSGSSCSTQGTASQSATASFSCPNGGTLSGSNCLGALTRTRYEAYGNVAAGLVPSNDIGFTGHVNDADTGLVYMQQRYYDPVAARFMSLDPVTTDAKTGGAFNRFNYANNNPYRYTDPDGRVSMGEFIDQSAQEAANRGNRLSTFGWSFAGAAWGAFGAEGISKIADRGTGASTGDRVSAGIELLAVVPGGKLLGEAATVAKEATTVIGRVKDLKSLQAGEQSLLERLPNLGGPKANWTQNSGVLRQEMGRGLPIRDASPLDTTGQFLNAERNLLRDRGWTFDRATNYWMPPKP